MNNRKNCSICRKQKVGLWFLTVDCRNCRSQWRAFYRGETDVSPLMRAIAAESYEKLSQQKSKEA